jgi:hypothetical protein
MYTTAHPVRESPYAPVDPKAVPTYIELHGETGYADLVGTTTSAESFA